MSSVNFRSLVEKWQSQNPSSTAHWSGTFLEYLDLVKSNPKVTRNAYQRMYDMILESGTEEYIDFKKHVIRYKFFDDTPNNGKDAVFGLDVQLMKLVNVLKAASLGYGTEKRVILLHGPVGSAKSTICRRLKKGLEDYSHSDTGAMYTFEWIDEHGKLEGLLGKDVKSFQSPMNEEPLLLIPEDMRQSICDEINRGQDGHYRMKIVGELCPPSRFIFKHLMERYNGDLMKVLTHVRVKRLFISEADRIGIGTFQPKDEKNQDSTELTGDINYRKIAEYGSDSDPRAFNFDGEFNVANRGMIEFVEVLKLDVAFLYDLLGASQEHRIKPKKFAQTYIDEVIIGHTNEPEYRKLQDNEFMEALRDRTVKIDIPYITRLKEEINIYKKDFNSQRLRGISIAPHTIEIAAMWAILTRLEKPKKANLTRLQKLKLYNGKTLPNFTEDNVKELRKETMREGLDGISPRYIQDKLSNALVMAQQMNKGSVNPFMVMNELESGLKHHSLLSNDELKQEYKELLSVVKQEYEEIIKSEVQRAISADDGALQRLCANYIDNVKAYTQKEKVRNQFTGADEEPDERLMRAIEEKIEIPESRKEDFRREIMNYIGALAIDGKKFNYKMNERLHKALELKLFEDQKDSIKLTSLVSSVADKDTQEKIDIVKSRLIKDFGYDEISATDVLHYVASIFARGDVKNKQ
ncbi:PrkA family serine protein kinase [Pseudobdellovibrio exovorus]|uniref:Serine protein kinase n=1 Tax=Pseudobdellovibrio exovorus JSS TaxID=1184267 RepID=M4V618_9BACT|nr:serine protein kinase [Pseudobdellovibrio exovorus]AGH94628.1 serine protein kinase [Pseudobdellovibrio exovorus JSS]